MKLVEQWRVILVKAWSVRLALLSAVLSLLEFAMPFLAPEWQNRIFAASAFLTCIATGVARIVAQSKLHNPPQQ